MDAWGTQVATVVGRDSARLNSGGWNNTQIEKSFTPGFDPRENYDSNSNNNINGKDSSLKQNTNGKDPREHSSTNGKYPRENINTNGKDPREGNNTNNNEILTPGCLVVSGALDGTLCVFRADFGEGLRLLRRVNLACVPEGLPGALLAGFPIEGGGVDRGDTLEVRRRHRG